MRLLPDGLFSRVVERGVRRPETFNANVGALFGAMSGGGEFNLEDILRFNGGLFADADVVALEADELRVLAEAARLDWASVEPAIFGTLFERSLDPSQRSRLGAHYTSKENILALDEAAGPEGHTVRVLNPREFLPELGSGGAVFAYG